MARENFGSLKNKLTKRTLGFLEKTFLQKKLNNWFGYLLIAGLAMLFGYLLAKNMLVGFGLFGALVGLFVVIICLSSPETGFHILMFYCFLSSFFSTLLFKGDMPIGIFFDALILLTFLGLVVHRGDFKDNFRGFIKIPLVTFILMTLFYNLIQIFNPNSRPSGTDVLAFRKFLGYVFILFSAYSFFDSYKRIRRYIFVLFTVAMISAIYGCIQQWHGLFNFELEPILADPHAMGLLFANGEFRKFSTMSDPTTFGILMAVCAVFFLILSTHEKNRFHRILFIAGSIFMILGLGYSGTRTANATIVVGIAFFVLLNLDKKSTRIFGVIAALVFLALLFGPFSGIRSIQRFRTTFMGSQDESYKVRILSRAWVQPYILSHPIGGGLGTTGFNGAAEHPGHFLANFQPDSSYVKRAAETGWIGLAIVCTLYASTLIVAVRAFFRAKSERMKVIYAACASSLFAFYIAEFAQVAIGGVSDVVVYYPILAIVLRFKNYDKDAETELPA